MKKLFKLVCLGALGFLLLGGIVFVNTDADARSPKQQASVKIINSKGEEIGTARITQKPDSVHIHIEAKDLPPGIHGIHFHETGKCEAPDFTSAGAHLNPQGKQHGFNNPQGFHAGDLLNIQVGQDGTVKADLESKSVTLVTGLSNSLRKPGGTAIVIHEKEDDYVTDPSGNSGNRIACGPIL
nr:superoxide dismutase family protein [Cohnella abietis]